jgi:UDP-glucuronate decarboxylase
MSAPITLSKSTILIAGGAGFLGSHLCETLLRQGHRVLCVDNFLTGTRANLNAFKDHPRFRLIRHDVCDPLDPGEAVHEIYNLACAASPPHYQADPIHTMRTCVLGTLNLLELAEASGARFVQASTSEV